MTSTAAIYTRISLDAEGRGLGVQRQEIECRELAARLGLQVVDVFIDNDVSAYRGTPRPAWEALNERIRRNEFGTLIAWHPDRLTRSLIELEALVELLETTATKVHTVTAGEYDLGTATGRMVARVVGAVARHESERNSERSRARNRHLALTGAAWGKRRAFGFEPNGTDHRLVEADAIRWAATQIIAGTPIPEIAAQMPPTTNGHPTWDTSMFRRFMVEPRLIGLRTYRGQIVAVGNWQPILDRDTWDQVFIRLARESRPRAAKRPFLLSGIAVDYRGVPVNGATSKGGIRRYTTTGSRKLGVRGVTIRADFVESLVTRAVREQLRQTHRRLDNPDWDEMNIDTRRSVIRETIQSIVILPSPSNQIVDPATRVVITPRATRNPLVGRSLLDRLACQHSTEN